MASGKGKSDDHRHQLLLEQDRGCLLVKSRKIAAFNPRAAALLHVEDPGGIQLFELLVPESWNDVRIAIEQVARGERRTDFSAACLRDQEVWIDVTVQKAASSGEVLLFLDPIPPKTSSENQEMKSRDHFHALVKNSSEGFTIFNEEAEIVYESPANKRIHGYEAHEVMGRNLFDFCVEEDREKIMPLFVNLQPGGRATGTVRFRHKEGHYIYLEGTIHHQLDHPAIRGIINNFRDITARIESEEELRRAKDAAERAVELQKRFLTNISHELRTPLTLIRQPLRDLKNGVKREAPRESLLWPLVEGNLDQLDRLITELLDLSQLEAGLFRLRAHELDLGAFTKEIVDGFAAAAESCGIELIAELPEGAAPAFFDPAKMEKAIRNLLANALKFTESGGKIVVRVLRPPANAMDPRYVIEVEDTGCGMDEVASQRAFDRFFQAESGDDRKFEGLGVGLALARAMARMHGGDVSVRTQLGVGSTFRLVLPEGCWHLSPEEIELEDEPPQPQPAVPATCRENFALAATGDGRFHLLLVEDNVDMRSYLAHHLSETFTVTEATNGREALDCLEREDFDLVLSDVMMPLMDGFELCRSLRNRDRLAKMPVILLSAKSTGEERTAGFEAGASDYITKPFFMPEVLERIRRFLPETRATELHPADRDWLEIASANIEETLSLQELTVEDMARLSGLSGPDFEKKLRRFTGKSPQAFLRKLRLRRARALLQEQPEMTLESVASEVGMNVDLLSLAYRSHFGEGPFQDIDRPASGGNQIH